MDKVEDWLAWPEEYKLEISLAPCERKEIFHCERVADLSMLEDYLLLDWTLVCFVENIVHIQSCSKLQVHRQHVEQE